MKHFVIVVPIDKGHDYCTIVQERQALEILRCMFEIGIQARLEYEDLEDVPQQAPIFDWCYFLFQYRFFKNLDSFHIRRLNM